jgi:hypothetical protein
MDTNIEAVFNMLLDTAKNQNTKPEDMPTRIYIFSDMEFNDCMVCGPTSNNRWGCNENLLHSANEIETLMEGIAKKWAAAGYKIPSLVFWNLDCRNQNIPAIGDGFSYVSGFSPVMIETILSGKDGIDLMLAKLNSERYAAVE